MVYRLATLLLTGIAALSAGCHHMCVDRSGPLDGQIAHQACGSCGGSGCGSCTGIIAQTKMLLACNSGCGEVYWDEWLSDPPDCCDPCDNHGNWTGADGCCTPPFSWCNLFGVRHGGATGCSSGGCSSGGCSSGGCSSCAGGKAHSFSLHQHHQAAAKPVEGQTVLVDEHWEGGLDLEGVTVIEGPSMDSAPAPPAQVKRTYRTRRR